MENDYGSYERDYKITYNILLGNSRPKRTWADGIRGLMGEKELIEDDWNDSSNCRKKIL